MLRPSQKWYEPHPEIDAMGFPTGRIVRATYIDDSGLAQIEVVSECVVNVLRAVPVNNVKGRKE